MARNGFNDPLKFCRVKLALQQSGQRGYLLQESENFGIHIDAHMYLCIASECASQLDRIAVPSAE